MGRQTQMIVISALWFAAMVALVRLGGGGWMTKAMIIIGVGAGVLAYVRPR